MGASIELLIQRITRSQILRMASLLINPLKIFLKPTIGGLMAKSGLSTELSKLPGKYRLAPNKGLNDSFKVPNDNVVGFLDDKLEMYLALEEKNGEWRYKSTYFIEGTPIDGRDYEFKVGDKFSME